MRLTCSYSILDDGSFDLHTRDRTLRLDSGPGAELWLAIVELAQAPLATRASVLNGAKGGSISATLAAFARLGLGLVRVEDTFILTPWLDADAVPTLGKIHLEITHRCNFACRACYVGPKLRRTSDRTGEATTDEWATRSGAATTAICRPGTWPSTSPTDADCSMPARSTWPARGSTSCEPVNLAG